MICSSWDSVMGGGGGSIGGGQSSTQMLAPAPGEVDHVERIRPPSTAAG
jgi:hypothetical protein